MYPAYPMDTQPIRVRVTRPGVKSFERVHFESHAPRASAHLCFRKLAPFYVNLRATRSVARVRASTREWPTPALERLFVIFLVGTNKCMRYLTFWLRVILTRSRNALLAVTLAARTLTGASGTNFANSSERALLILKISNPLVGLIPSP